MCRGAGDCQARLARRTATPMTTDDDKKARLAQALRDNLRRRKAQARGEESAAVPPAVPREPSE